MACPLFPIFLVLLLLFDLLGRGGFIGPFIFFIYLKMHFNITTTTTTGNDDHDGRYPPVFGVVIVVVAEELWAGERESQRGQKAASAVALLLLLASLVGDRDVFLGWSRGLARGTI